MLTNRLSHKKTPTDKRMESHSAKLKEGSLTVLEIKGLREAFLLYLTDFDLLILSHVSKKIREILYPLAFKKLQHFLALLDNDHPTRIASSNILTAKKPIVDDSKFLKALSNYLSDLERHYYQTITIHHAPRTRLKRMFGEWIEVEGSSAWTETRRSFNMDANAVSVFQFRNNPLQFLLDNPTMGQFLGKQNQAKFNRLRQLRQLLDLTECAANDDLVGVENIIERRDHCLMYFQLSTWFEDMANFSRRQDRCPLHIAISRRNVDMMIYLIDQGAIVNKTHLVRMEQNFLEKLFDHIMVKYLNRKNIPMKLHRSTMLCLAVCKNVDQLIVQAVSKRDDDEKLSLLAALLDNRTTAISQLISGGNKILLQSLRLLYTDFSAHRNRKMKTAMLLGTHDRLGAQSPIKRSFNNAAPTLFRTIFEYAGVNTITDPSGNASRYSAKI